MRRSGTASLRVTAWWRQGFTLIELVVVVCIIAVFLGILLPCLTLARAAAGKLTCAGRLRQVGMTMQHYAADNDGIMAPPGIAGIRVPMGWPVNASGLADNITYANTQLLGQYDEITLQARVRNPLWTGSGVTFDGRDTIFHCPRDPRRNGASHDTLSYGLNERFVRPFVPTPTAADTNPNWGAFATLLAAQSRPAERVLFIDASGNSFHPGAASPPPVPMLSAKDAIAKSGAHSTGFRNWVNWHGAGANLVFVDGHVRFAGNPSAESQSEVALYGP